MDTVGRHVAVAFTIDGVRLRLAGGHLLVMESQAGRRSWEAMGIVGGVPPAALPKEAHEADVVVETDVAVTLRGTAICSLSLDQRGPGWLETSITLRGTGDFEIS